MKANTHLEQLKTQILANVPPLDAAESGRLKSRLQSGSMLLDVHAGSELAWDGCERRYVAVGARVITHAAGSMPLRSPILAGASLSNRYSGIGDRPGWQNYVLLFNRGDSSESADVRYSLSELPNPGVRLSPDALERSLLRGHQETAMIGNEAAEYPRQAVVNNEAAIEIVFGAFQRVAELRQR